VEKRRGGRKGRGDGLHIAAVLEMRGERRSLGALLVLLDDLLGVGEINVLGLRVKAGEVLLLVSLALGNLVRVHLAPGKLVELGDDEVEQDADGDDAPLVALGLVEPALGQKINADVEVRGATHDTDDLEDIVRNYGDVEDREGGEGADRGRPKEDLVVE
jgi:hypothetical protein